MQRARQLLSALEHLFGIQATPQGNPPFRKCFSRFAGERMRLGRTAGITALWPVAVSIYPINVYRNARSLQVKLIKTSFTPSLQKNADPIAALQDWQRRLGNPNVQLVMRLFRAVALVVLNAITSLNLQRFECEACSLGRGRRQHQSSFCSTRYLSEHGFYWNWYMLIYGDQLQQLPWANGTSRPAMINFTAH
jgi:hypothetical protein